MGDVKRVRRIEDGVVFKAVRYAEEDGSWSKDCITKVAGFVLGLNPDNMTTVSNERMLDVVQPLYHNFDPANGKATILVADPPMQPFEIELGDWVLRSDTGTLSFIKSWAIDMNFEVMDEPTSDRTKADELCDFIYDRCMDGLEGELYEALAEHIASELIQSDWINKEKL